GQRRAAPARQDGRSVFPAASQCGEDVIVVTWDDYADGNLAIAGTVGRVQRATAAIEANLAADLLAQIALQSPRINERLTCVPRAFGKSLGTLARENGQWVAGHEKSGNVPCSSKTGCMARTCRGSSIANWEIRGASLSSHWAIIPGANEVCSSLLAQALAR